MAGFIQEEIQKITPNVPNDFRHALCVGETGCGKTTSFILPNMLERMKNGNGLFVIDFKGNLHSQVKALAHQEGRLNDVFEVGVPWGSTINIFKNISRSMFINSLNEINGKDGERFWISSALNLAGQLYDVFALMQNLKDLLKGKQAVFFDYELSTVSINKVLSSYKNIESFLSSIKHILNELALDKLLVLKDEGTGDNDLYLIRQFSKELEEVFSKLTSFYAEIDQSSPASGSGGVLFSLKNLMHTFTQVGLDGSQDLQSYLESGKIVILRSESYDDNVTNAIMNILYQRLLIRRSSRGISLFIDEFQRTVSPTNLPYIDLFREMKVELIAAMQNINQLENKITEEKCHEFLGNVLHNFFYADHRENTLKTFEFTLGKKKAEAQPIFIERVELFRAQILWQNFRNKSLPNYWVYHRFDGHKRALILNIKTGQTKYHYILSKQDSLLKDELQIRIELQSSNRKVS